MRLSTAIVVAFGPTLLPAMALLVTNATDDQVFLDDEWPANTSTNGNEKIEVVDASGFGYAHVRNACPVRFIQPTLGKQQASTSSSTSEPTAVLTPSGTLPAPATAYHSRFAGGAANKYSSVRVCPLRTEPSSSHLTTTGERTLGLVSRLRPRITTGFHKHLQPVQGCSTDPKNSVPRYRGYGKNIGITLCG